MFNETALRDINKLKSCGIFIQNAAGGRIPVTISPFPRLGSSFDHGAVYPCPVALRMVESACGLTPARTSSASYRTAWISDDATISFRSALNLVHGDGCDLQP